MVRHRHTLQPSIVHCTVLPLTAADVWSHYPTCVRSLGCILCELYTGYPLFPGENEHEQLLCMMELLGLPPKRMVAEASRRKHFFDAQLQPLLTANSRGKVRVPGSRSMEQAVKCKDAAFVAFIRKCLRWEPKTRMTPEQGLQHDWITQQTAQPANTAAATAQPHTLSSGSTANSAGGGGHSNLPSSTTAASVVSSTLPSASVNQQHVQLPTAASTTGVHSSRQQFQHSSTQASPTQRVGTSSTSQQPPSQPYVAAGSGSQLTSPTSMPPPVTLSQSLSSSTAAVRSARTSHSQLNSATVPVPTHPPAPTPTAASLGSLLASTLTHSSGGSHTAASTSSSAHFASNTASPAAHSSSSTASPSRAMFPPINKVQAGSGSITANSTPHSQAGSSTTTSLSVPSTLSHQAQSAAMGREVEAASTSAAAGTSTVHSSRSAFSFTIHDSPVQQSHHASYNLADGSTATNGGGEFDASDTPAASAAQPLAHQLQHPHPRFHLSGQQA